MSVEIDCLKVIFSISLPLNTSYSVFCKSVGPVHSLQSGEKTIF
jgi:hypothetical protein